MSQGDGPYRSAPVRPKHVCTTCFHTYSVGPGTCARCRVARESIEFESVHMQLVWEAKRRLAAPRFRWGSVLDDHTRLQAPKDRPIEQYSSEELIVFLEMQKW